MVRSCDANADCRGKRLLCDRVADGFERGTQPLCQLEGVLPRRIRQQARELFTSHSAEQIRWPQLRSRQPTKCDEHRVTGRVPEFVVDTLEVIEIERKKRGRSVGKTGSGHQSLARLKKTTTVRNACQRID